MGSCPSKRKVVLPAEKDISVHGGLSRKTYKPAYTIDEKKKILEHIHPKNCILPS